MSVRLSVTRQYSIETVKHNHHTYIISPSRSHTILHCVSKNAPTLASCSFDKHELILIIFGKQYQHIFKNDTLIQLSSFLYFYVLYLLLNSCDGNGAFWRHSTLVKQPSSFIRKHQILSLQISVRQTVRTLARLTTEFGDKTPVCDTSDLSSASLTHGQVYHKMLSTKQFVNGEKG